MPKRVKPDLPEFVKDSGLCSTNTIIDSERALRYPGFRAVNEGEHLRRINRILRYRIARLVDDARSTVESDGASRSGHKLFITR